MNNLATEQELFEKFKRNMDYLIGLCKDKTIVFDFDGTLTRFQYAADRMLPCKDDEIEEFTRAGGNIYQDIYILKTMKYIVQRLNMDDVYVLTSTVPSLREIKNQIIIDNFNIPRERIIHTDGSSQKIKVLEDIHSKTSKRILFLEDNYKILLVAEENLNFVKGYHTSCLLP